VASEAALQVRQAFLTNRNSYPAGRATVPLSIGSLSKLVILSYTRGMKTAISMPDETYERVSKRANDLGMSRSEFFSRAADRYLEELDAASLSDQINEALDILVEAENSTTDAVTAGHRLLESADDDW